MKSRRRIFYFLISLIISVGILPLICEAQDNACQGFFNTYPRVIVSSEGNYFATGDPLSGSIRLLEKDGNQVWGFQTGENISSIAISDNGEIVVAASKDGGVFGFDKKGDLLWKYDGMGCFPKAMITNDGQHGYIINSDRSSDPYSPTIRHFYQNGTVLWETREPGISSASITKNGEFLVVGTKTGRNSEVRAYSEKGTGLWRYSAPDGIESVAISEDGNTIVAVHSYRLIVLDSRGILLSEVIPKYRPTVIAISQDSRYIASGSTFTIQFFNGSENQLWQKYENGINSIAISKDGQIIIVGSQEHVSCFNGNGTRIWDVPIDMGAGSVSMSSEGNAILAGLNNGTVYLLNREGDAKRIPLEKLPVRSLPSVMITPIKEIDTSSHDQTQTSPVIVPIILVGLGACIILRMYQRKS